MELVATGEVEGLEVRAAPVGGVVWDRGLLARIVDGEIAWSVALPEEPLLSAWGRRLYVAIPGALLCLDLATGAVVWAAETSPLALHAHPDGVDALLGDRISSWGPRGDALTTLPLGRPATAMCRTGPGTYVAGEDGVWRVVPGERPALLYACRPLSLHDRAGKLQALVAAGHTQLVEDDGLPLVWSFPEASTHIVAPWGAAEWAVAPRTGGVWVVDRRLQTRWKRTLPGEIRALAVAGRAIAAVVDDGGPVLALIHPDVSDVLLLAVDPVEALHTEGEVLYLTHQGRTAMFVARES